MTLSFLLCVPLALLSLPLFLVVILTLPMTTWETVVFVIAMMSNTFFATTVVLHLKNGTSKDVLDIAFLTNKIITRIAIMIIFLRAFYEIFAAITL